MTAEAGGFQLDKLDWRRDELEGLPARVPFARPSSCWDICARRRTVFPAESGKSDL
jgi:hypothetical protein